MLCPNCKKLINVDVAVCPFCQTSKPGSWIKNNAFTQNSANPMLVVNIILAINVGFFIISILINPSSVAFNLNPMRFLTPDGDALTALGMTKPNVLSNPKLWWTMISANWLHGSLLHIIFNMMALRQVAFLVLREFGLNRMLILYLTTGFIGYLISNIFGTHPSIGASGALCGLVGALLYFGKSRGGVYGQAIYKQTSGWVLSLAVFGFLIPGINNWAHGGGLVAGMGIAYILGYNDRHREVLAHKMVAAILVIVTAIVLVYSVISGIGYMLNG
jgi:rhomboid protease GluP